MTHGVSVPAGYTFPSLCKTNFDALEVSCRYMKEPSDMSDSPLSKPFSASALKVGHAAAAVVIKVLAAAPVVVTVTVLVVVSSSSTVNVICGTVEVTVAIDVIGARVVDEVTVVKIVPDLLVTVVFEAPRQEQAD